MPAIAIIEHRSGDGLARSLTDPEFTRQALALHQAWVELLQAFVARIQADRLGRRLNDDEIEEVRSATLLKLVLMLVEADPAAQPFSDQALEAMIHDEIRAFFNHRRDSRKLRLLEAPFLTQLACLDGPDHAADGATELSAAEQARDRRRRLRLRGVVEAVRRRVSEKSWAAFWSITVEGVSIDDAAALLGMTYWAAQKANVRVRESLKAEAARQGIE